MSSYKGISNSDKQKIISALKAREVQETSARDSNGGATIPAVMIVCQHCGFIAQHALQPLGLWSHAATISSGTTAQHEALA